MAYDGGFMCNPFTNPTCWIFTDSWILFFSDIILTKQYETIEGSSFVKKYK